MSVWRIVGQMIKYNRLRCLMRLLTHFALPGMRAVRLYQKRLVRKEPFFPPFLMISLTQRCQYRCRGCWVTPTEDEVSLSFEQLHGIVQTAKAYGNRFFGLLGGEPLMYDHLDRFLEAHRSCYFQVFTNGAAFHAAQAQRWASWGHVTPVISLEGLEDESERRRGGHSVFARTVQAIQTSVQAGLFTGVATSVCANNFETCVSASYLDFLTQLGVSYLWYYIYRPCGAHAEAENALSAAQIERLRRFIVEQRCKARIWIIDAYWDADGEAVCPAAMGLSHHINARGDLEFCPPVQFRWGTLDHAATNVASLLGGQRLDMFRKHYAQKGRGCLLLSAPQALFQLGQSAHVEPSSGRDFYAELRARSPLPDHDMGAAKIPEKSWVYRWGKRYYFFGFGAYG